LTRFLIALIFYTIGGQLIGSVTTPDEGLWAFPILVLAIAFISVGAVLVWSKLL